MNLKRYIYLVLAVILGCCQNLPTYAVDTTTSKAVGTPAGVFSVSPLGAAVYTMSIDAPKGYGNMQPNIALVYNSQSGYGIAGYGVNISGLSVITRGSKDIFHDGAAKGMSHVADDAYFLDGKRLIYQSGNKGQDSALYVPEGEPYTKVMFHGKYSDSEANTWIEVITPDGITYQYGRYSVARISYISNGKPRIHAWLVNKASDAMGRFINYRYQKSGLSCLPSSISYGMSGGVTNTISFTYESIRNANTQLFNIDGQKGRVISRLKTITTATSNATYRTYECVYDSTLDASKTKYSRLTQLIERNANGEALNPIKLNWKGLPASTPDMQPLEIPLATGGATILEGRNFFSSDINGDGINDVIEMANVVESESYSSKANHWTYAYLYLSTVHVDGTVTYGFAKRIKLGPSYSTDWLYGGTYGQTLDLDGDGKKELLFPELIGARGEPADMVFSYDRADSNDTDAFQFAMLYTESAPLCASLDVLKNGREAFVGVEPNGKDGKYPAFFVSLGENGKLKKTDFSLRLNNNPRKMFVADYNGDGLTDLIFLQDNGYTVYYNQGGSELSKAFDEAHKYFSNQLTDKWRIVQGDFNGDGLVDFAYFQQDWDFFFALNNGDGTFDVKKAASLNITERENTGKDDDKFSLLPYDMDGDGKTDLLIVKGDYKYSGGLHTDHHPYRNTPIAWFRSDGEKLHLDKEIYLDSEDDALEKNYFVGCFSTDGQVGVLHYGKNIVNFNGSDAVKMRLLTNSSYSSQLGKLVAVTDGMGNSHNITYDNLLSPASYTHQYDAQYPMADVHLALPVVKSVASSNGSAGVMTQEYGYAGLKAHDQGKGLLGFAKSFVKNNTLGETAETEVTAWNTGYFLPSQTKTVTSLGSSQATSVSSCAIIAKNATYFSYPSITIDTDFDGFETRTVTDYNTEYGYLNSQTQYFDGSDMYKLTGYAYYQKKGGVYLPALLVSTQKHSDDSKECSHVVVLSYDDKGQVVKKIDNAQSSNPLTTLFTYDKFGNVLTSTQSGTGVPSLTNVNTYDATGRFVVKNTQNPTAFTTEYTYDIWGDVLTKREYADALNPHITSYSYDGWGHLISTVDPMGVKKTVTYENLGSSYRITKNEDNGPSSVSYYDAKGRVFNYQTEIEWNLKKTVITNYNAWGQKTYVQDTFGGIRDVQYYSYDNRGRLIEQTDKTKGTKLSYQYEGRKTTTIDGDKTYVKKVDAWGNVVISSDPVSEVSYTYASNGQPSVITTNGTSVKMTYDNAGNKVSMEDPDAGTVSYNYAADGKLLSQTDARGIKTEFTYDVWGKLLQKQVGDMTFVNTYGTSGIEKNLLVKKTLGSYYEEYAHDKYGRLVKKVRNAYHKKNFQTEYAYNSKSQLTKVIYPGGLAVSYNYDSKGYPVSVRSNSLILDSLVSYDGLVSIHQLPYGMTSMKLLSRDLTLQRLNISKDHKDLYNMYFTYDAQSGNLLSRTGMQPEKETFEYDALDRLVAVNTGNASSLNISYANNGNITSKTDVGNYTYSSVKPHAVESISQASSYQWKSNMDNQYNDMGKIEMLSQRQSVPINVTFEYGADGALWNMNYLPQMRSSSVERSTNIGGNRAWSRYYDDDYELLHSTLCHREFYFLTDKVMAVRDKEGDFVFYVLGKDNLGSIVNIFNKNAEKVFSATYDAWGKQTVINSSEGMEFLLRGYCGHDMLNEFDLVNMKGRLYDPVVGRFLSPDNYVQLPDNGQSYNRYSYCLNNPLKYVDPDGEYFGWDDIFAMAIGGCVNLGVNIAEGNIKNVWHGLSSFAVGAAAGECALYGHMYASSLIVGAGNSIVNQGFTNGFSNINWGQVAISSAMSIATSKIGANLGVNFENAIDEITSGISNELVRSTVNGALVNATSGMLLGTGFALANGKKLDDALEVGLHEAGIGVVSGAVMGIGNGVAEIRNARKDASLRIDSQIDPNAIVREALASPTMPKETGTNSVYVGVDDNGVVRYVGITKRDPARRFAEHCNSGTNRSGLEYHVLDGTGHLSRTQARIIEQKLINAYKMQQNGGILYNQRNSIELFK